jgi:hypothetical protein
MVNVFFVSQFLFFLVSNDTQVYENPQEKGNLDDDDISKKTMKLKILKESSMKSGEETETSSYKQEQFKKVDSTGEGSDVESSLNTATKVIHTPLRQYHNHPLTLFK